MVENNIRHNDLIPDLVEVNYIVGNPDKFYSIHRMNNSDANDPAGTNECKETDYIVES